jgi:glutamyl-Q tRNA(Asp) synthetase
MPVPVFRFAPSPNGPLHLGHALSALTNFEWAKRLGGRFLVRIEDIDIERSRETFVTWILEDLRWLGLHWEEPVLRQSDRFAAYEEAALRLRTMGLLYPCFATRREIAEAAATRDLGTDPDGALLYPHLHKHLGADEVRRRLAAGERCAWRLDMERAVKALNAKLLTFTELDSGLRPCIMPADPRRWGDAVIQRKDVPTSYHLSVVIDDALQGVTHVVRGRDLFAATDLHRLLQDLLGLPAPVYHHHRLVTDAAGRKLAKSARDTAIRDLRKSGVTPLDIRKLLELGEADFARETS